jgi:hypothetical protein
VGVTEFPAEPDESHAGRTPHSGTPPPTGADPAPHHPTWLSVPRRIVDDSSRYGAEPLAGLPGDGMWGDWKAGAGARESESAGGRGSVGGVGEGFGQRGMDEEALDDVGDL